MGDCEMTEKSKPKRCIACERKLEQKTANIWACPCCKLTYWLDKEVKEETGWISVEDRLPETGKLNGNFSDVVLVFDGKDIMISSYCHSFSSWTNSCTILNHISHWRPLPEPPEAK